MKKTPADTILKLMRARDPGLTADRAKAVWNGEWHDITEILARGESFNIPNFGTFIPTVTPSHRKRRVSDGRIITVPEKIRIRFRPSPKLTSTVNRPHNPLPDNNGN